MPAVKGLRTLASALLLAGCVRAPVAWERVDGATPANAQVEADTLACKGQVEAAAVQGQARSTIDSPLGMDSQDNRIFIGCMAGKGYLAHKS